MKLLKLIKDYIVFPIITLIIMSIFMFILYVITGIINITAII